MADQSRKLTMSSTKQEMLEAYNELQKELKQKREAELKPEKKAEEKKAQEAVAVADALSIEGVTTDINTLRLEVGRLLSQISDRMEEEVTKFKAVKQAIAAKEKAFQELFEIEREAETLAALLETQQQKRRQFEEEMAHKKAALEEEIESTRTEWKKEQEDHSAFIKERDAEEKKKRDREREDFTYAFEREKQKTLDAYAEEKQRLEKEIALKKEELSRLLEDREKAVAEKEAEMVDLRQQVQAFSGELTAAVEKAVKETTDRLTQEHTARMQLRTKEFEGERNVLTTRIDSLEQTVQTQKDQLARISDQLEKAYQKVQEIAMRTVDGSSQVKALNNLQQIMAERTKTLDK